MAHYGFNTHSEDKNCQKGPSYENSDYKKERNWHVQHKDIKHLPTFHRAKTSHSHRYPKMTSDMPACMEQLLTSQIQ